MSEERARRAAHELGLEVEVVRHGAVRSLAEAAEARGVTPHQYRFVLAPGDREISWPKLRSLLGVSRMSMPSADVALEVTGYERGTITPLGSTTAWPVIADASLDGTVSLGGGAHGVAFNVEAAALVVALGALVADVTDPA